MHGRSWERIGEYVPVSVGVNAQLHCIGLDDLSPYNGTEIADAPAHDDLSLPLQMDQGDFIVVAIVHQHGQASLFAFLLRGEIEQRFDLAGEMLLASANKRGSILIV